MAPGPTNTNNLTMKRSTFIVILLAIFSLALPREARAGDDVALKTNLLYDVALSPNLGIEFGLAPKWSLDVSGNINAWTVDGRRWRHWLVQPEARYWLCERFQGHFFGLHAIGGQFNVGNIGNGWRLLGFRNLHDRRYEGWMAGAGIAYGYAWVLNKHWNLEAELGLGWLYTRSDVYPCENCGTKIQNNKVHNYVGPTKLALNIVYIF